MPVVEDPNESAWVAGKRREARRYWDAHPIAVDSVDERRGSRESFEELYSRWSQDIDEARRAWLETCRGKRVLEVGCGIGRDARYLAENGIDYRGVDYSIESLKLASSHFDQNELPRRFANGDAAALPLRDDCVDVVFSIGVVHHIPDVRRACRELVRVLAPGGTVRVMVYNRASYHYWLLRLLVIPLVWLMLKVTPLAGLASRGPRKFQELYEIAKRHGFSAQRLLDASTDTSTSGADNFNPLSHFLTERDLRVWFSDLEDLGFERSDLKYCPLPQGRLRDWFERRCGFFLTMTATKRAGRIET